MMDEGRKRFYITTFHDYSNEKYVEGINNSIVYKKAKLCPFVKPDRSLFLFNKLNPFRICLKFITESKIFEAVILLAILASCIVMAMGSPVTDSAINDKLQEAEIYFIVIFLIECTLKVVSYGFILHKHSYLRNGWNMLDFSIVVIGIITFIISKGHNNSTVDIKGLRAFRVLRPIRLISKIPSLQIVLNSILLALKSLANVGILILFLIIVYSIVGMNLFMGKLHATCYNNVTMTIMNNPTPCRLDSSTTGYFCTDLDPLPPGQQWTCMDLKGTNAVQVRWSGPHSGITNFDNMGLAMLTVFQMITKDGWTEIMYWINDSLGSEWPWIYFVSLVLMVTFFVMNLILGVLSGQFSKECSKVRHHKKFWKKRNSKKNSVAYSGYKHWIEYADTLNNAKDQGCLAFKNEDTCNEYLNNIASNDGNHKIDKVTFNWSKFLQSFTSYRINLQKIFRKVIKSRIFFVLILALVFLNTAIMATEQTNTPNWLSLFQEIANIIFVILFTLELIVKLFATGPRKYFSKLFNIFDFIVVCCSIIELCLILGNVINQVGLSVLRCARLLRIFKLTRYWDSLRILIHNMLRSMKSILSLLFLLGLYVAIFALLGMQLFAGKFPFPSQVRFNFDTFFQSIFTVFQIITGDSWSSVMYTGINAYNGIEGIGIGLSLYFVILYVIGNYILLNVFLAIAVQSIRASETDDDEDDDDDDNGRPISDEANSVTMTSKQDVTSSKIPEITQQLVLINGGTMFPPVVKSDIESLSKIINKGRRNTNHELRMRIDIKTHDDSNETEDSYAPIGNITYNELYAEEQENDPDEATPIPKMIPKSSDFKILKEIVTPIPSGSAFFIFEDSNRFRIKCYNLVNHSLFKNIVLACIIISSITLAVEDPVQVNSGRNMALKNFDYLFTAIFLLEILIKFVGYGIILHRNSFLRSVSNWIDLIVVVIGLIDNCFPQNMGNDGLSAMKTLRVFRVLRPLRTINRAKGLKHVMRCVAVSLKAMTKIIIITFLLEFMFAVIGVISLKGAFYSCTDPTMVTKDTCNGTFITNSTNENTSATNQPRVWSNGPLNYDNVINGMLTLFTVTTLSGWSTLLYQSIDATSENQGPRLNNNPAIFLFYLAFLILIAFLMINIFVGLVIVTFHREGNAEYSKYKLDKNMCQCIDFVIKARPIMRHMPTKVHKYKVWRFVCSKYFDNFVVILIVLNTVCLATNYSTQSIQVTESLKYVNAVFTILFTVECLLKMYAFDVRNYFGDSMNIFDIVVICGSYVDLIFSGIQVNDDIVRINLFRLFRVLRLIRLLCKVESMRRLLWTFMKSFRSLPYVILLTSLTFFIYAIMGMQFFGRIGLGQPGSVINRNNNFQTLFSSLIILFRCVTGESWQWIMMSCNYDPKAACVNSTAICGTSLAYVYFPSFIMICSFLIINLFVAVIIDNFDYLTRDSSILGSNHLDKFITIWSQYDSGGSGRIKHLDFIHLLSNLDPPLGFGKRCPQIKAFRNLIQLNMPLQTDGTVLFNATLFTLVRQCLKINYSETVKNKEDITKSNNELRTIIRTYWPNTSALLLDQIISPNISESVTIGKFYATNIIETWFKKCKMKKMTSKKDPTLIQSGRKLHVPTQLEDHIPKDVIIPIKISPNVMSPTEARFTRLYNIVWPTIVDIFTISEDNDI